MLNLIFIGGVLRIVYHVIDDTLVPFWHYRMSGEKRLDEMKGEN